MTPELWGSIQKALADADYFILLASPQAAQSKWVEQEVDWWLRNRSATHLLVVRTDGELTWDRAAGDFDWTKTTALPRGLEKVFEEDPNHLDLRFAETSMHLSLRQPKFLEAIAGLSATLQDRSLDELIGEDLGQHQKTMRWLRFAVTGFVMLTIAAGLAFFVAQQARLMAGKVAGILRMRRTSSKREAISREVADRSRQLASPYAQMRGASWLYSAWFSPDGNRVALVDWGPAVCDVATGKALFDLEGHAEQVRDIGYSPDGQWLVTASEDHTARIWHAATGKSMAVLPHDAKVIRAMFSPGGRWIVTRTADDRVIRVWDAASRKQVSEIDVRPKELDSFALSLDGNFLVTAPDGNFLVSEGHTAEVFETRTGARVAELTGHTSPVLSPGFSPDGQRIVTAGLDGEVNLYAFKLGGTTTQLLTLARDRVPRQLTAQERAHHLPVSSRQQAPVHP